jgi:hypothetical protein
MAKVGKTIYNTVIFLLNGIFYFFVAPRRVDL